MRFGLVMPFGDARQAAELAALAERSGWDGFFCWEPVWGDDAWVSLTAAAMRTERIRLGTMLTPLPRIRPWSLAGTVANLDRLSGGRVILSVGLGAPHDGWRAFEPDPGRKVRAELLDEGLDVLTGLWAGQPFGYDGAHYAVRPTEFMVPQPPVQRPRVPTWVVGAWPRERSMARAARWDGVLPNVLTDSGEHREATPDDIAAMAAWLRERRAAQGLAETPYDVVVEGTTPGDDRTAAVEQVAPWERAGATWWIEADWSLERTGEGREALFARVAAGPPRP